MIVAGVGVVASVAALFVGIVLGVLLFPRMQADSLLFMWDILVLAFLFYVVVTPMGTRLCRPSEQVLDILPSPQRGAFTKEDGEVVINERGQRA